MVQSYFEAITALAFAIVLVTAYHTLFNKRDRPHGDCAISRDIECYGDADKGRASHIPPIRSDLGK